ncbi:MAG: glycoside hydrolase family 13 protein [Chloroherpetonaceae bacterium]|nr:glycoside hydrolase family 13 protein [Chloroherpetonaceae bacterium]MDW8438017.1 glycoside hydrolase family 13 protein [Chloroherpetonaceae bacterium]
MEWTRGAIFYQIFPERFRNGNPNNDPSPDKSAPTAKAHRWTSNWYALSDDEKRRSPDFWQNIYQRRYGGDLQGILDKLDYLQALGIDAIYLNPIFEAVSAHKYDATLLHHVDVNFGNDPEGDLKLIAEEDFDNPDTWRWTNADLLFLKLIEEAHKRNIRIVIDGVFNHVGTRFPPFQDVVKHQTNSRYKDWFEILSFDDSTTGKKFDYKGWWGHKSLPELKRDSLKGLADAPKRYVFAVTKRWTAPNGDVTKGVDGWRLDAADDLPHAFWKEWRAFVKSINPNCFLVGEIWVNAKEWMKGDEFDAVMNYQFAVFTHQLFVQKVLKPSEFKLKIEELLASYPDSANYALLNLYDSHDTERLPSRLVNPTRHFDHYAGLRANKDYQLRPPNDDEYRLQKLLMLFQFAYVGAPMLYYGTEAGMWGADDPDCRKPMVWREFQYDDENAELLTGKSEPFKVAFNERVYQDYKTLIDLRRQSDALKFGTFKFLVADDEKNLIAFERAFGGETLVAVFNLSSQSQTIELDSPNDLTDLLTKQTFESKSGKAILTLASRSGLLLRR